MTHLVELDADHPGFRDTHYRERRNAIARVALAYRSGDPVPDVEYHGDEHELWRQIRRTLGPLHDVHACAEVRAAQELLPLREERIPQLREINSDLVALSGFRMEPVAGLIEAGEFLAALGQRVFLSTQYIRHTSRPFYTPEPDVVHELVGHAATLAHPWFSRVSVRFGRAAEAAKDSGGIESLARLYWYSLEYGLVRERGAIKAVGAGLISSSGEISHCEGGAELRAFDADEIVQTVYDPTDMQPVLFVADSLEAMESEIVRALGE